MRLQKQFNGENDSELRRAATQTSEPFCTHDGDLVRVRGAAGAGGGRFMRSAVAAGVNTREGRRGGR